MSLSSRNVLGLVLSLTFLSTLSVGCHSRDTVNTPTIYPPIRCMAAAGSTGDTCIGILPIRVVDPNPTPTPTFTPVCEAAAGSSGGCIGNPPADPVAYSATGSTRDVDLQRAQVEEQSLSDRAGQIAQEFDMSFENAVKLTALSDQVQELTVNGQTLTAADRQAVIQAALEIAGVSQDELNQAITKSLSGDETATNDLLQKAALNLGMPSSANLREKLLPALGVNL